LKLCRDAVPKYPYVIFCQSPFVSYFIIVVVDSFDVLTNSGVIYCVVKICGTVVVALTYLTLLISKFGVGHDPCIHACLYVCVMYTHMYVHTCIGTYIHTYMYTYVCTRIGRLVLECVFIFVIGILVVFCVLSAFSFFVFMHIFQK
jgi:hypothetical protein